MTLHRHNSWSFQLSKDSKRIIHGCLQLVGSFFVFSGTFLALSEVNMQINTAHGICGKMNIFILSRLLQNCNLNSYLHKFTVWWSCRYVLTLHNCVYRSNNINPLMFRLNINCTCDFVRDCCPIKAFYAFDHIMIFSGCA